MGLSFFRRNRPSVSPSREPSHDLASAHVEAADSAHHRAVAEVEARSQETRDWLAARDAEKAAHEAKRAAAIKKPEPETHPYSYINRGTRAGAANSIPGRIGGTGSYAGLRFNPRNQ